MMKIWIEYRRPGEKWCRCPEEHQPEMFVDFEAASLFVDGQINGGLKDAEIRICGSPG